MARVRRLPSGRWELRARVSQNLATGRSISHRSRIVDADSKRDARRQAELWKKDLRGSLYTRSISQDQMGTSTGSLWDAGGYGMSGGDGRQSDLRREQQPLLCGHLRPHRFF